MLLTYYLSTLLAIWVIISIYLSVYARKVNYLKNQPISKLNPSIAIIIAVRNEEDNLEQALQSVCNIAYPNYKITVVNDRSTDGTQRILDSLLIKYPQLCLEKIDELPKNWLGKNYALYTGYLKSDEDWLLFTDADVLFDKESISKAISYVVANQVDHLAIFPEVNSRSKLLNSVLQTFAIMLDIKVKPWEVSNKKSKSSIGIGAFNLIKRSVYDAIGTHKVIKMRPDDDLKLGEKVKIAGFKQDVLYGLGQISLEWYTSVSEFINGLMKNTFSVFNYNIINAIVGGLTAFLIFCTPIPLGLIFGTNTDRLICIIILVFQWALFHFRPIKNKWWDFLLLPFAGALMTFIIFKSTFLTLLNKGIYWRDSFYSLKDLKDNK
jgi:glycosyltransferase involved in cell wall biosynthesis